MALDSNLSWHPSCSHNCSGCRQWGQVHIQKVDQSMYLGSGSFIQAPPIDGSARHDCAARCSALHNRSTHPPVHALHSEAEGPAGAADGVLVATHAVCDQAGVPCLERTVPVRRHAVHPRLAGRLWQLVALASVEYAPPPASSQHTRYVQPANSNPAGQCPLTLAMEGWWGTYDA